MQAVSGIAQFQTVVKLEKESLLEADTSQDAQSLAAQVDVSTESRAPDRSSVERAPLSNQEARGSSPKPPARPPAKNLVRPVPVASVRRGKVAEGVGEGEVPVAHPDPGHRDDSVHVAMPGSRKPRAVTVPKSVQPAALRAPVAKASKAQTSSSSEAEVSSDDEDTDTNESPCWRSSRTIQTHGRRAGPRRTVPGKPEGPQYTAVTGSKVARKPVRRRREIPYDAASKDDAKKFRGVTRKYGPAFMLCRSSAGCEC